MRFLTILAFVLAAFLTPVAEGKSRGGKKAKEDRNLRAKAEMYMVSLSILPYTPTMTRSPYEGFMQGMGVQILGSGLVFPLSEDFGIDFEAGVFGSYAGYNSGANSYTHMYFGVPVRMRGIWESETSQTGLEFIAGAVAKFLEYSSEPPNSGFRVTNDFFANVDPDFGIGLRHWLSPRLLFRVTATTAVLGAGIEAPL